MFLSVFIAIIRWERKNIKRRKRKIWGEISKREEISLEGIKEYGRVTLREIEIVRREFIHENKGETKGRNNKGITRSFNGKSRMVQEWERKNWERVIVKDR